MGSTGMLFARNVQFEATFPELGRDELPATATASASPAEARPAGDQPQALHPRAGRAPTRVADGHGMPGDAGEAQLRLQEGAVLQRARRVLDPVHDPRLVLAPGARAQRPHAAHDDRLRDERVDGVERPLTPPRPRSSAAGPDDRIDAALVADERRPPHVHRTAAETHLARAPRRPRNIVTAWWDASQIYGYDERLAPAREARSRRSARSC